MNTHSKPIENTEKRIYTSPKLVSYGAVRTLTKANGTGSSEALSGNSASFRKP